MKPRYLFLRAAVAAAMVMSMPGHAQDCGDVELTQSLSLEIWESEGVACAAGRITTENSFARCYPPSVESFTIRCVDIGIRSNTGSDLPAALNIYIDSDGCPPTHPGIDLVLLSSELFIIPADTFLELFEIELSAPVLIYAGETLVVELDYPAHTDGAVRPGMNVSGQTAHTYARSEPCGIPKYVPLGTLDFPCCHWVQVVKGLARGIPGDLDGDGVVGVLDLLILLAGWGPCPDPPDACSADLDADGFVGILDLLTLLANWG